MTAAVLILPTGLSLDRRADIEAETERDAIVVNNRLHLVTPADAAGLAWERTCDCLIDQNGKPVSLCASCREPSTPTKSTNP